MKAQRSKEIVDENEDKWEVIDKYEIIEWDVVGDEVINDILIYAQGEKLDFDQDYFINLIKETYKNIECNHLIS